MKENEALGNFYSVIEQAMSNGMFKKISDLQLALQSYYTLKSAIEKPNLNDNGNSEALKST